MPESTDDTQSGSAGDATAADAQASADAASKVPNEVSLLTSRLNGQTAKVGELTGTLKAKDEALAAALKRVADLEAGTVSADEAAKAQVAAAKAELESERRERRVDSLKTRFPESFSVLGDAAFSLDETSLAANEARLLGDAGGDEPPTPLRHNETKSSAPAKAKEESAKDVEARLLATPVPWA